MTDPYDGESPWVYDMDQQKSYVLDWYAEGLSDGFAAREEWESRDTHEEPSIRLTPQQAAKINHVPMGGRSAYIRGYDRAWRSL